MNNNEEKINSSLKLLVKSSIIIFMGLILSKILTYLYRIIIARFYGPEIYGIFSLAVMILGWFVAISSFGFTDGLLRYVSWYRGKKQNDKIRYILKFSIIILLFSGIISAITLFLLAEYISINFFHNPELIIFLKIFSFLIPVSLFANIFLFVLQSFEKISWHSFILNILQNCRKLTYCCF